MFCVYANRALRASDLLGLLLEVLDLLLGRLAALVPIRLDLSSQISIHLETLRASIIADEGLSTVIARTALSLSDARLSSQVFLPSFCAFKFSCFFFSISSERPSLSTMY
jgi:hypothetical protein